MAEFTPERIEKIRAALIAAGYVGRRGYKGCLHYAHFDADGYQDADSCVLPPPGEYDYGDLPNRATECIRSLIQFTGNQHLELGPLTPREEAYEAEIQRYRAVLEAIQRHQEIAAGTMARYSAIWTMADVALKTQFPQPKVTPAA